MRTEPLRFNDYRLENVYLRTSPEQRAGAADFWLAQGALRSREEGALRALDLVYLVRRSDGTLAGMSTVGTKTAAAGRSFFVFRMFLREQDRTPYLMREVTNATRDFLRGFDHPQGRFAGMLIVTENRKLMRPGIKRYFERHGYLYRGKTGRGLDLWLAPFDG